MKKRLPQKNTPDLWIDRFRWPKADSHKYNRGYAIINGGDLGQTGAAKIAAYCALRVGAGVVSVACTPKSLPSYSASFQSIMTKLVKDRSAFSNLISDERITAVLLGPGNGVNARTKSFVIDALRQKKSLVLDADALTVFSKAPNYLFKLIASPCILTPHEGEFLHLFGKFRFAKNDNIYRAQKAADESGAVIVLKGFHTVIAAPDGRFVVNTNATPFLATAGSGDALAGICTGLLAQGMPMFEAACAAVWIHADAASHFGPGLISEDIADLLPLVLRRLRKYKK
ncbi:MAG: NAD(P)H-hydrate dehydratase [Alphaproteobacteria bacterium]|nr:MAG: NAD(P)H-hydrate dehydratase [Alphaproteobacteria bacterium]